MLLQLPPEVFFLVIKQLNNQDLKVLAFTSKAIHNLIVERLWRSITLEPKPDFGPYELKTDGFPTSLLKYTSELRFGSEFYERAPTRCPSHDHGDNNSTTSRRRSGDADRKKSSLFHLGNEIQSFLSMIDEGKLRSFSWNLGTCIPKVILGPSGILGSKHTSLEALNLGTSCQCADADASNIDLSPFRQLKSLYWDGLHDIDVKNLSVALANNAARLENFELNLLDWHAYAEAHGYGEGDLHQKLGFIAKILPIDPVPLRPYFPSLRVLSLTEVPIGSSLRLFINFAVLESLTIRRCPDWSKFLSGILRHSISIRLKTFEFTEPPGSPTSDEEIKVLEEFLDSFASLAELFLSVQSPVDTLPFWDFVASRHTTLSAFVYHMRTCREIPNPFWGPTATELDHPCLDLATSEIRELDDDPSCNSLSKFNVEHLGLSCIPEYLRPLLLPFVPKKSLKLLHVRQSAYDLEQFAPIATLQIGRYFDRYSTYMHDDLESNHSYNMEIPSDEDDWESVDLDRAIEAPLMLRDEFYRFCEWAFGPDGLTSLEVIASGDFSFPKHPRINVIFVCREPKATPPFEIIHMTHKRWHSLVEKYGPVLKALPADPFTHFDEPWIGND